AAVGARLLGVLCLDDRRVEDHGLARAGLHRVERGARRGRVLEQLLRWAQLVKNQVDRGGRLLCAELEFLEVGERRRPLHALGKQDALVSGEVGNREADHLRALSGDRDRKSTRLNSSHVAISYAVFCLKKK